jgi:hydrogenase maturation protease
VRAENLKVEDLKILIAGIGNIFNGDDGFGVEVVKRLQHASLPEGVHVKDFGIRSFDLAFGLVDGYQTAILVDALQRGEAAGTLYVFEPDMETLDQWSTVSMEGHELHPAQVLKLATLYGSLPEKILVVGCEPAVMDFSEEGHIGLSAPVQANLDRAVGLIESLVQKQQRERAMADKP